MRSVTTRRYALLASLLWPLCTRAEGDAAALTVAAAADLRPALQAWLPGFRAAQGGARVDLVYGSSGKLATQLRQGAPFDLLLSADLALLQPLHADGLVTPPRIYARGRLSAGSAESALGALPVRELLTHPRVQRIALANPSHAPYGQRALQVLQRLGLAERLAPRLVMGENVAQAMAFVASGAAQAGLVARSLALGAAGAWREVDAALHDPLPQALALGPRGRLKPLALAFAEGLLGAGGQALLRQHGFDPA